MNKSQHLPAPVLLADNGCLCDPEARSLLEKLLNSMRRDDQRHFGDLDPQMSTEPEPAQSGQSLHRIIPMKRTAALSTAEGSGDGTTERPAYCSLHPDEGTSTDGNFVIYLYYDESTDKCSLFKYLGTGGNDNRFEAEVYCMRNCSPSAESIYPADRREGCLHKKNSGECMGQYLRYYYDAIHQKCHSFFWTGCVGNGNRFLDMATCNATCQGVSDQGDDLEEEEHDTPVGLILGVILGLAGAAILVVVAVLAVKSKPSKGNKPPKATPRSAAPVVRSDEDIEMRPSDD